MIRQSIPNAICHSTLKVEDRRKHPLFQFLHTNWQVPDCLSAALCLPAFWSLIGQPVVLIILGSKTDFAKITSKAKITFSLLRAVRAAKISSFSLPNLEGNCLLISPFFTIKHINIYLPCSLYVHSSFSTSEHLNFSFCCKGEVCCPRASFTFLLLCFQPRSAQEK